MGISIPQVVTEDRASGALVADGSLKFDGTSNYLTRSFADGNRKTWTWAAWVKRYKFGVANYGLFSYYPGSGNGGFLRFSDDGGGDTFRFVDTGNSLSIVSKEKFRDTGWYHIVIAADTTLASESDRVKRYVNGVRQTTNASNTWPSLNDDLDINQSGNHFIGRVQASAYGPVSMSNVYFIDGQALGPGYFGYTDPLTNTWRPKKFRAEGTTLNDGTQWSSYMSNTSTADNLFDGDLTTFYGPDGNPQTWIPAKPIEVATSVRIYYSSGAASRNFEVNDNGNVVATGTGTKWVDLQFTGKLTKISGSAGWNVGAIEIDGEILVDSTTTNLAFGVNGFHLPMDENSPIGQDQAPSINDGTIWSSFLTGSTNNFYASGQSVDKAFDGDTSTYVQQIGGVNPNYITFTPSGGIAHTSKVEVYINNAQNEVSYNGGSLQSISSGWNTIATGSGTLTSIRVERPSTNGAAFGAIRIDGVILIDGQIGNSWTPVNFGGSTDITKATGALPILNTLGGTVARPGVLGSEVSKKYTVTTGTYDSATRYELDGVDRPAPRLYRGGTYTFDYTAVTGHPLYLSSLPDGKHNSKAYSVSFDGTGDALRVPDHADLRFGTGAFTVECYVWFNSFDDTYPSIISKYTDSTASWIMRVKNDGKAVFYTGVGGGTNNESSRSVISLNKWHHIAMVRDGGVAKMYVDGKLVVTATDATDYTDTQEVSIGAQNAADSNVLNGYLSNVRIIKGTALYTTEFTPPTTTLTNITNTKLLCCQDSDELTAAVIPSGLSITKAGNPDATNSHNPFLYNNVHGNFGVNTSTSNVTKITIPHYAADGLYYYCNQHSGMGNTTAMSVVTDTEKADPHAWKCILAVPMLYSPQNAKFDFSGDINCTTTNDTTITNNSVDFNKEQSIFYRESADVTGSQYLSAVDLSTWATDSPWTVEFWWYRTGANQNNHGHFIGGTIGGTNQYGPTYRDGSHNDWQFNFKGQSIVITPSPALQTNKWEHHAFTSNGSNISYFRDGVFQTTAAATSMSGTWGSSNEIFRGGAGWNTQYVKGYVCDMRVYAGVEKYTTAGFIPASTNPDILLDTPSGLPVKTQLAKVPAADGGSIAFASAQSDYLNLGDDADTRLTNTFSIEFFYNEAGSRSAGAFITDGGGNSNPVASGQTNGISYQFYYNAGTIYLNWSNGSGTWYNINNVVMPSSSAWHHVLVTNDNSRTRMFIDGVLVGQHQEHDWGVASSGRKVYIGTMSAGPGTNTQGSYNSHGYISNFRMCNGSVPTDYATTETTAGVQVFTPPKGVLTTTSQGATANHVKLLFAKSQTEPAGAVVAPNVSGSINTGTQWSNYLTGAGGFQSSYPATKAFNGTASASETSRSTNNGETQTFTPPSPGISYSSKVEVWTYYTGNVSLNGGSNVAVADEQDWTTIATGSGTIERIDFIGNSGNSIYLGGIRIDSTTILLDPLTPNGNVFGSSVNPFTDDINTVRGQEGAYATLNPLKKTPNLILSEGNLKVGPQGNTWNNVASTIGMTTGKFYFECVPGGHQYTYAGIANADSLSFDANGDYMGGTSNDWGYLSSSGDLVHNTSSIYTTGVTAYGGDVIGVTFDCATKEGRWYVNGVLQYTHTLSGNYPFFFGGGSYSSSSTWNFGQKPFKFPPPDGYQPLTSSAVRPDTVISRPDQYVLPKVYTGNGGTRQIDYGFRPDLILGTPRNSSNGGGWNWVDSFRGGTKYLSSNSQSAGGDFTGGTGVTFNSTGVSLVDNSNGDWNLNGSPNGTYAGASGQYVYYGFKSGGAPTATNDNTSGAMDANSVSIDGVLQSAYTPSGSPTIYPKKMSIGTKQGFSIVQYAGVGDGSTESIPHGLSEEPDFSIIKNITTGSTHWAIYHRGGGAGATYRFANNHKESTSMFGGVDPANGIITLKENSNRVNNTSQEYICYAWHNVPGLQKFGSFTGNGSQNFVSLDFRPAIVWVKRSVANSSPDTSTNNSAWVVMDDRRLSYNGLTPNHRYLNFAGVEGKRGDNSGTSSLTDMTLEPMSNGFYLNGPGTEVNANTGTYIYCAWAEAPQFNLYGAQSNAR